MNLLTGGFSVIECVKFVCKSLFFSGLFACIKKELPLYPIMVECLHINKSNRHVINPRTSGEFIVEITNE